MTSRHRGPVITFGHLTVYWIMELTTPNTTGLYWQWQCCFALDSTNKLQLLTLFTSTQNINNKSSGMAAAPLCCKTSKIAEKKPSIQTCTPPRNDAEQCTLPDHFDCFRIGLACLIQTGLFPFSFRSDSMHCCCFFVAPMMQGHEEGGGAQGRLPVPRERFTWTWRNPSKAQIVQAWCTACPGSLRPTWKITCFWLVNVHINIWELRDKDQPVFYDGRCGSGKLGTMGFGVGRGSL